MSPTKSRRGSRRCCVDPERAPVPMMDDAQLHGAAAESDDRNFVDRRSHTRISAQCAGELLLGPLRFPCSVVDISAGGAQLGLGEQIAPLSPATLRIVGHGALHCRVIWNRAGRTGVRFLHDPGWVKARVGVLFTSA